MIPAYLSPLANHLWQSTLFTLAAALLTLAFHKNRAAVRHWLWLAASLKFLVPFALIVGIVGQIQWPTGPALSQPSMPHVLQRFGEIDQPFGAEVSMDPPAVNVTGDALKTDRVPVILMTIWLCGFVVCIFGWLNQWRRVHSAFRRAAVLNLNLPIRVMSFPGRLEPGVFGIVRPVLMLPEGIADRLAPAELQTILAHELCHVRRRDNLAAALHLLVEAIFWFYPLVWWIETRLVEEQENACDEEVVRLGNDPQAYSEAILKVCEFYLQQPVACVSGVTGADLKRRIRAIMKRSVAQKLAFGKKLLLATAGMIAVTGPVAVGLLNAQQTRTATGTRAKFDVASIKLQVNLGAFPPPGPGRFSGEYTLEGLIRSAYITYSNDQPAPVAIEVLPAKILQQGASLPPELAWVTSDYYVVIAEAESKPSQQTMRGPMLQVLLEDRFKLKTHRETRNVPVYTLTVANGEPKLKVAEGGCVPYDVTTPLPIAKVDAPPGRPAPKDLPPMYADPAIGNVNLGPTRLCGTANQAQAGSYDQNVTVHVTAMSFNAFANYLSRGLDRPVVDATGINGVFTFDLKVAIDQTTAGFRRPLPDGDPTCLMRCLVPANKEDTEVARPGGFTARVVPAGLTIFEAMEQQLGLKLERTTGPVEFLVIDHLERPTAN